MIPARPRGLRAVLLAVAIGVLAACTQPPDDAARRVAIADHVLASEDYPARFVRAENFVFRNVQRVPDATPAQYAMEADFDLAYTADGAAIVAALREQSRAERAKAKRRANNVLEKAAGILGDALAGAEVEERFEDVRAGDRDHFTGRFVLARNEDGSWRVEAAEYR